MFQQIVLSLFLGQSDEPDSSVTSVRVWDLGFGCHDFWHPVSTDGGPVGYGVPEVVTAEPEVPHPHAGHGRVRLVGLPKKEEI